MSEPTYTITTKHEVDPRYPNIPWAASAVRVTDGFVVPPVYSGTEAGAVEAMRERLRALAQRHEEGHVFYADENGEDCAAPTPEPGSVRA